MNERKTRKDSIGAFFPSAKQATPSQQQALEKLSAFLMDSKRDGVFILKGAAGTGKSLLLKAVYDYVRAVRPQQSDQESPVTVAAPTGKAALNLQQNQVEASTIHRLIYTDPSIDEYWIEGRKEKEHEIGSENQSEQEDEWLLYRIKFKLSQPKHNYVVMIDEASMISDKEQKQEVIQFGSGRLLDDILSFMKSMPREHDAGHPLASKPLGKKLILAGDPYQLFPIGSNTAPAMDEAYLQELAGWDVQSFELHEIVRQTEDAPVLADATEVRNALLKEDYTTMQLANIHHLPGTQEGADTFHRLVKKHNPKPKDNQLGLLAWKNYSCLKYAKEIRRQIYGLPDHQLAEGEKLLCVRNTRVDGGVIYNGELLELEALLGSEESLEGKIGRDRGITLRFQRVRVNRLNGPPDAPQSFELLIFLNYLESDVPYTDLIEDVNKTLYVNFKMRYDQDKVINPYRKPRQEGDIWIAETMDGRELRARNQDEFFKKALQRDPYYNALQVTYGYVLTVHKAQGSEWNNAILIDDYSQGRRNHHYFRWVYTGITRAKRNAASLHFQPLNNTIDLGPPAEKNTQEMKRQDQENIDTTAPAADGESPIEDYKSRLDRATEKQGLELAEVCERQYALEVLFRNNQGRIISKVYYDSAFNFKPLQLEKSDLDNAQERLLQIERDMAHERMKQLEAAIDSKVRQELFQKVWTYFLKQGVHMVDYQPQPYRDRYRFECEGRYATLDFPYDGKHVWKKPEAIKRKKESADLAEWLLSQVHMMVTESNG